MTRLTELEQRLRDEPDNLGLRVSVAGALHEVGRRDDAIELYRSVAIAYRDQGRPQQAITVCRGILELAPGDLSSRQLLATLLASQPSPAAPPPPRSVLPARSEPSAAVRPGPPRKTRPPSPAPEAAEIAEPVRRSSGEATPLPPPLPYHEADPTTGSVARRSRPDLPPGPAALATYPEIAGIAAAARQISASLIAAARRETEDLDLDELEAEDLAAELDTGRLLRTGGPRPAEGASVPPPVPRPPTPPPVPGILTGASPAGVLGVAGVEDDDPTLPPRPRAAPRGSASDDDHTEPRELPTRVRPPRIAPPAAAVSPLAGAFFAPLPPARRAAVLQRFRRRIAVPGTVVIRRGETGHGLVVVVRGRLDLHAHGPDGTRIVLGAIAPGEFVGETSLLARAPAATTVVAGVDSELLVLAPGDFHDLVGAFPALGAELGAAAARRARAQGVPP